MQCQSASFDIPSSSWEPAVLPKLDSARTLVLAFGAPELADDPRVFSELARAYPRSLIVGCSSAGEIHGTTLRDHSLAVTVTRFDRTDLLLASLEIASASDSHRAGATLARKLAAKPGLRAVLVLSEGLHVNGSELVRGLSSSLPPSVVVTGGLSADGPNFRRTWVAIGPKVGSDVIAAVGFYGDYFVVGHGSKGGWDKFGPERLVTRSEGNVLFELDGRPALALYKEYLGDKAKDLPASGLLFPLAIRASSADERLIVRTLLSVDHERQSLTFAGDLPTGYLAQLMKADFDRLIDGAGVAGSQTFDSAKPAADSDSLVIAISCVGRRLVLGERTEEEIEAVRDAVRSDRARITGFYSYGEISPFASGPCDLHNQTMTLTLLSESPTPIARADRAPAAAALALGTLPAPPRPERPTGQRAAESAVPQPLPRAAASKPVSAPPRSEIFAVEDPGEISQVSTPPIDLAAQAPRPIVTRAPSSSAARAGEAPVVRVPAPVGTDATVELSRVGELQLVRLRGRITEAFKGDQLGRTLGPRVVFDLAHVDRVTSFGVREWLAMLAAASRVTELTFVRCSEAVVNQLTMIRKFDGGARIASFFAPYLCDGCGTALECLRDCELHARELADRAPTAVRCPRCDGEARFDDDPRSYFAFAAPHFGVPLPSDVRALSDELSRQPAEPPLDDIEKIVSGEGTRVRVRGRLGGQLRWRKVFDGLEGTLIIDLSTTPGSDASGITNLEQALLALAPEVAPICVEHAPPLLVERLAAASADRVRVTSAAVAGFCRACAVTRPATLQLSRLQAGEPARAACKRCNGPLEITLDEALRAYVERQRRASAPSAPSAAGAAPSAAAVASLSALPAPTKPSRGLVWGAAALAAALAGGVGVMATRRDAPATPPPPAPVVASAAAVAAPAPAWQQASDLPPAWTEREISIEGDDLFVVGRARTLSADPVSAGLEAARRSATLRLVQQLAAELEGSPVAAFVAARARPIDDRAAAAVVERFEAQHGKHLALTRVEVATRRLPDGSELFVRYRVANAEVRAVLDAYRATATFRGLEVALFFPSLETALHTRGQLVVVAVDRRSAAALAGLREGDAILAVGGTPVSTLASFRNAATSQWGEVAPRGRLSLEVEAGGLVKTVALIKPAAEPR